MRGFRDDLVQLLKARFPVLYIESYEEQRVVAEVAAVARDAALLRTPRTVWTWSATEGLIQPDGRPRRGTHRAGGGAGGRAAHRDPGRVHLQGPAHGAERRRPDGRHSDPAGRGTWRRVQGRSGAAGPGDRGAGAADPARAGEGRHHRRLPAAERGARSGGCSTAMIAANAGGGRIRIEVDERRTGSGSPRPRSASRCTRPRTRSPARWSTTACSTSTTSTSSTRRSGRASASPGCSSSSPPTSSSPTSAAWRT